MSSYDQWKGPYAVVIDTDSYTGNFERDLCAYCTGVVGECEVGKDEAKEYFTKYGFDEKYSFPAHRDDDIFCAILDHVMDDHGCFRPCCIWPGSDHKHNSMIIYFQEKPTKEQIDRIKERSRDFGDRRGIKILAVKVISRNVKIVDEVVNY